MHRGIKRGRAGFALLDVMFAGVVLTVAVVGTSGAMLSAMTLQRGEVESALARQAARRAIEELQGAPVGQVFRMYNSDVADNVGLTLGARGPNFAVAGLTPAVGDADGQCGRVEFPIVMNGIDEELREDSGDAGLGMPSDLDGDTIVEAGIDQSATYVVLPVRVLVEWRGLVGTERYELATILSQR